MHKINGSNSLSASLFRNGYLAMASGLAGKVRRATESEEFDLANYDQERCNDLAKGAFGDPFPLQTMVRISFVVGGGKLVRQKYSDDLPKLFMNALSAIGFSDDSAAACEADSGGKYKYQHDTGKNLKFVHVYPHIIVSQDAANNGEGDAEQQQQQQRQSPEEKMLRCGLADFERLFEKHLPTYAQRKGLLDALKARVCKWNAVDEKVRRLERLDAEEEALYNDDLDIEEVQEKDKKVSASLEVMVDEGNLTSSERTSLLSLLDEKRAAVEGKGKQAPQKLVDMIQKVKDCSPVGLPPLKFAKEIRELTNKLNKLAQLEKASKGKYSLDELKALGERPDIEEALANYKESSRGWFEADEVFEDRLQACLRAGGGSSKKGGSALPQRPGSAATGSGFTTVSGGARQAKSKASAPSTRNAFGALDR